jgi:hypothetical protein
VARDAATIEIARELAEAAGGGAKRSMTTKIDPVVAQMKPPYRSLRAAARRRSGVRTWDGDEAETGSAACF